MNPLLKKFAAYSSFQKYEYREVSKPYQTLSEHIKNFNKIFFDWRFKTTYIKDLKSLKEKPSVEVPKAKTLQTIYSLYKLSEVLMAGYLIHSFVWHFRKGYFHTRSKITEAYIIGKIVITLFSLSMCSFFVLKRSSDSIMFEYFNRKEEEWDKMVASKAVENEYIKDYVTNKDKNNIKNRK